MTARDPHDYFPAHELDAVAPDAAASGKAGYIPPEKQFSQGCPKCGGSGQFRSWSGRTLGQCFACKGKGKQTFKTSPADRAKAQAQRQDRADRKVTDNIEGFKAAHPAIYAHLMAEGSDFAISLLDGVLKYGSLTAGQMAAVERGIARKADRAAAAAERIANAPVVETTGIDALTLAFDKAAAYAASKAKGLTIRNPKITVGDLTISPAKANSKNPGALYVKCKGTERDYQSGMVEQTYLGKIADGKFYASRDCTDAQRDQVLAFVASPADAAKVYGQETGVCCVCNATLKSEWRLRGIGPICAEKFGW